MKLLHGEKILLRVDLHDLKSTEVVLTSHRVQLNLQTAGFAEFISIMLDELASCGRVRISKPIFLWLAPLCYLAGFQIGLATGSDQSQTFGLIAGLVFVGLYFFSRRQVLALTSAGDSIRIQTKRMTLEGVVAFIDAVEEAKNARYLKKFI